MRPDEQMRMPEKAARTGSGGGYRFNFYGQGGHKEKDEEEEKKKKKQGPVNVHLSHEAEEVLVHEDENTGELTAESPEIARKRAQNHVKDVARSNYLDICKKRGHE